MQFKPDILQLRAEKTANPVTGIDCIQVYMIVNGVRIPFCFDVHKFCSALEYSGRIKMFCLPGQQPVIVTAIVNSEGNYWVWKNYFNSIPVVWYFERNKVLRQLKRLQTTIKKLTADDSSIRFMLGETTAEVIAYKYSRPKLLWIDYLNKSLAVKLHAVKNNGWKSETADLSEIEYLLNEGAYIYKEDRNGLRLLDRILEQPNKELRSLVCKIANYPLAENNENSVTLLRNGEYKTYRAPKHMSLREAQERDFLVEQF